MSCLLSLLRYRLLHEGRQAVRGTASLRLRFLIMILAPVFGAIVVGGYYEFLIQSDSRLLHAGGPGPAKVLEISMLVTGAVVFLIMLMETLQQCWFAHDGELLAVAPVSIHTAVAYRFLLASLRGAPWTALFLLLPVLTAFEFSQGRFGMKPLIVFLMVLYWVWLAAAALGATSLILAVSNRLDLGRHGLYGAVYLLEIILMSYLILRLLTPSGWLEFAGRFHPPGWFALFPPHQVAAMTVRVLADGLSVPAAQAVALTLSLVCPPILCYFAALRLWHRASHPTSAANPAGRASRPRMSSRSFSTSRSWAIFQKDLRDLFRNPAYRNALIATSLLLLIGVWAQARKASSSRLPMMTLPLICYAPLLISGRAASQEFKLLELYKLVLPCRSSLLDAKLQAHSLFNLAAAMAASLPFFFLLKPGFQLSTVLWFTGEAVLCVPVLTALALALGTYFPDLSSGPGMLGVRLKGLAVYILLGSVLYSLLLNRMAAAAGLYFVFLAGISTALFLGARRRLYALIEWRPR